MKLFKRLDVRSQLTPSNTSIRCQKFWYSRINTRELDCQRADWKYPWQAARGDFYKGAVTFHALKEADKSWR